MGDGYLYKGEIEIYKDRKKLKIGIYYKIKRLGIFNILDIKKLKEKK